MNKDKYPYRNYWRMSFAAFLAVVLTLAPCSVRNSLEHSLGLKTTSVHNKSKSAEIKPATCLSVDIESGKNYNEANFLSFDAALADDILHQFFHLKTSLKHFSLTSYIGHAVKIPLYILYSNFKYHL